MEDNYIKMVKKFLLLFLFLAVPLQAQSLCKKGTTCNFVFIMVQAADNETAITSLADITCQISKNTGAFVNVDACTNGGTECTELANGWYFGPLTVDETNTVGPMILRCTTAGATANEYRGVIMITDTLMSTTAASNFELMYGGTGYAGGTIKLNVDPRPPY